MVSTPHVFRFSIAFQGDKRPGEYEALAGLADHYDFDVVSVYNDLMFQPALGPLMLMARKLRRAQVGFAALNPFTLHPVEIAGQVAMLDLVSHGRAYLGLARGAWLAQIGVPANHAAQTLREAIQVVRHVLARRPDAFDGDVFKIAAGTTLNYAPLRERVPIMIGTWGRHTATMAGELADEIKIGGSANPGMAGVLSPALRQGERIAGRPDGTTGICLGAVTVVDEDREAARAKVRCEASLYLPVVAALDPTLDDPEWLGHIQSLGRQRDYAAISASISDAMLDKFAFAGNPHDVIHQVEALIEAGATRVEFGTPHGLDSAQGIKLLGERVLPHFGRQTI